MHLTTFGQFPPAGRASALLALPIAGFTLFTGSSRDELLGRSRTSPLLWAMGAALAVALLMALLAGVRGYGLRGPLYYMDSAPQSTPLEGNGPFGKLVFLYDGLFKDNQD